MVDIGLFIVRLVIGGLILGHGLQKLTGWFDGPGPAQWAEALESMRYRRTRSLAWVHALTETGAGVLLVLGALTPLAAAMVIGVMVNAIVAAHAHNGLWSQDGGFEYPLVLGVAAAGLAVAGPGALAVDTVLGWSPTPAWAVVAIVAGLLAGGLTLVAAREPAARRPARDARGRAATAS